VTLKIMGGGDRVKEPPSGRILSEIFAKFWEFSRHS
jgi:hypothetical protein